MNPKEQHAEPKELSYGPLLMSKNGIEYHDFRPLRYCSLFEIIMSPTLERCLRCDYGKEILSLTTETKEMYLDAQGNINEKNSGKDDLVKAEITLATLSEGKKIVRKLYEGVKRCPREL